MIHQSIVSLPAYSLDVSYTEFLMQTWRRHPNRLAFIDYLTKKSLTYRKLGDAVENLATNFVAQGLAKGDVVCVMAPNCIEFVLLLFAVPHVGGIVTGVNPLFTEREIIQQIKDSGAKYLVCVGEALPVVQRVTQQYTSLEDVFVIGSQLPPNFKPFSTLLKERKIMPKPVVQVFGGDTCILPYSSGTTGTPKGVMISHANVIAATLAMKASKLAREGEDTVVAVFPFYHIGGALNTLYHGLYMAVTLILIPKFDFKQFLEANHKYKTTYIMAPPPVIIRLAKDKMVDKYNLSTVKRVFTGGAPIPVNVLKEFTKRLNLDELDIRQGYGMTETTGVSSLTGEAEAVYGSSGRAPAGCQLKIVEPGSGRTLGVDEDGEVCVRGPVIMKGYLNRPKATAEMVDKEGWLHSGDIGHVNKDGNLFITDRMKELIKYKGYQVAPAELEALLLTHPGVADAAVIGVPAVTGDELPRAYITPKPGVTLLPTEIEQYVQKKAVHYKWLRGGVHFLEEIPKSQSGKILRRFLRDKARQEQKITNSKL